MWKDKNLLNERNHRVQQIGLISKICPIDNSHQLCYDTCFKCARYNTYLEEMNEELEDQAKCNGKR